MSCDIKKKNTNNAKYRNFNINVIVNILLQAVAKIGANLSCLHSEPEELKKFLSVITDAEWGIKLGKLEVPLTQALKKTLS